MPLVLRDQYIKHFVRTHELEALWPQVAAAHGLLHNSTGPGNAFLGWLDLPVKYDKAEFERIKAAARRIQNCCDAFVVIGVGGSYLGARAAVEFIRSPNYNALPKNTPDLYFTGNTLNPDALSELLDICTEKELCINVVSKSGTTAETAIAFRAFRALLEQKYGKDGARGRIFCTTDPAGGSLRELAETESYETFAIPQNVGGRFSALSAVGLLPGAVAGCDIEAIMRGAADARAAYARPDPDTNDCYRYAAYRNLLREKGAKIEVLAVYDPALAMTAEWFKQLFGESEGKERKGLFPASMIFSTDLHSLGQFVQDGPRILFETLIDIKASNRDYVIPEDADDRDGLQFLGGLPVSGINKRAMQGTLLAHTGDGVPNMVLELPRRDAYEFGWLVYFFEKACAISGYLLGVNPFDQPGVEAYKRNMLALLGKPGLEELRAELLAQL